MNRSALWLLAADKHKRITIPSQASFQNNLKDHKSLQNVNIYAYWISTRVQVSFF